MVHIARSCSGNADILMQVPHLEVEFRTELIAESEVKPVSVENLTGHLFAEINKKLVVAGKKEVAQVGRDGVKRNNGLQPVAHAVLEGGAAGIEVVNKTLLKSVAVFQKQVSRALPHDELLPRAVFAHGETLHVLPRGRGVDKGITGRGHGGRIEVHVEAHPCQRLLYGFAKQVIAQLKFGVKTYSIGELVIAKVHQPLTVGVGANLVLRRQGMRSHKKRLPTSSENRANAREKMQVIESVSRF